MTSTSCPIFFNKGPGFEAKIKRAPGDFIVDEVSSFKGEIKNDDASDSQSNLKRVADEDISDCDEKRPRTSIPDKCVSETVCVELDENNITNYWNNADWCRLKLEKVLTSETLSNLKKYASVTCATLEKGHTSVSAPIFLGKYPGRDERIALHRCVRFLYPYLRTVTAPRSGDMSVEMCPNYWKFYNLIGEEKSSEIFRFIHVEVFENLNNEITVDGDFTKEVRRKLHHLIASCFGKFMEARTLPSKENGNPRLIAIRRKPHLGKNNQSASGDEAIVTAFTLWKKNCETYGAIHHIGRHLNIPHSMFNFAGIKDKRAITTQKCTVTGISPHKFAAACKSLPKYLKVSNCHLVSRTIRLGELRGNRFCIRLTSIRNLNADTDGCSVIQSVERELDNVKTTGFVNYFGPQRFGRRIENSENEPLLTNLEAPAIGLAMLQSNFSKAVKFLLMPTESTHRSSDEANAAKLHFQKTKNVEETLRLMPSNKMREISVLRTLKRYASIDDEACAKALLGLPYTARLLYVHSFCSHVWNLMATSRLIKYGDVVVVGDLVKKTLDSNAPDETEIVIVTEKDIAEDTFAMKDVVLPTPGSQVSYPPCLEAEYRDALVGFSIAENHPFRIPALKLHAPGAYRKLIEFPRELSHKILPHKGSTKSVPNENSDRALSSDVAGKIECPEEEGDNKTDNNPSYKTEESPRWEDFDMELRFELPPSCYATTFLSELTKGHLM